MSGHKHIQKTLTPIILKEGMAGYDTVKDIEEKLNDPEVFNIAITGPYGSGKSTVLKSLKEQYGKNHHFLTISLASLTGKTDDSDNGNGQPLKPEEQAKIEYSLLQQLIYKEKAETLPNSRFRRINRKSWKQSLWFALSVVWFIVCWLIVFEPAWLRVDTLYQWFDLGATWNLTFDILCSVSMIITIGYAVAYSYRKALLSRIRTLNLKDVKIELNEDSSVFNKHLEEIVYFFESTDYNVVIIEDLDRFRCPEIFQKLREINFLLRESKVLKEQNRQVKFIYAIKDDLFRDAERTKFFDYIATVIPVVNPKNSCEKLTQELNERGYKLDKDALRELSEFVDDMRMLKNVANEFQQYMERLSKSGTPNKEKLLAMIIYKNHHPDDFGSLHYKKGKVYDFIKRKHEWLTMASDKVIKPRMEVWKKRRDEVENTHKLTLKQWRVLYMEKYRQHLSPSMTHISVNGTMQTPKAIEDSPELFEALIKQKNVTFREKSYYNSQSHNETADVDFSEIEREVDDQVSYLKRKEMIATPIAEIDNEIRMVREEENRLRNFKLAKLLIQFPEIKQSEEFKKIGLSELMVYFLQRGYIDETYYDYLTIYDGTTMSLADRDLLSRIKQNDCSGRYDDKIDDIEAFVEELPLFVYEYKSVLNYQIADFLESHPVVYQAALKSFEEHFLLSSTPPLDFMAGYYKKGSEGAARLWSKYVKANMSWQRIQTYEKQEYWDTLTEAWLSFCEKDDVSDSIRNWLNDNLGFCIERLRAIGVEHLKETTAGCKFTDIMPLGPIGGVMQGEDVLDVANHVIENKMFELTPDNIYTACVLTSSPFGEQLRKESLTLTDILHSNKEELQDYVMDNIKHVFESYLVSSEGQEEEDGLLTIVNEDSLDDHQKTEYLRRQKEHKISSLDDVEEAYRSIAVKGDVVQPTWENVICFFETEENYSSEELADFIGRHAEELLREEYPAGKGATLAQSLVYSNMLEISSYKKFLPYLMKVLTEKDESAFNTELGSERVGLLVSGGYLSSNKTTAKTIKTYGNGVYAEYLTNHIATYLFHYEDYAPDVKSLALMLSKGSRLSKGQKWSLAKLVSSEQILADSGLANAILYLMWKRKEELTWTVVEAVLKKANHNETKVNFMEWLLKQNRSDVMKVTTVLKAMQNPYADIVNKMRHPLVPNGFKAYLDLIQPLGLFTSYKEEEKGLRVYHSTK